MLAELGFKQNSVTVLLQDNRGSISFAQNEVNHSKMKHIALRHHFICHLVANKEIHVSYVPTSKNLADIFTKPLGKKMKFADLRAKLQCVRDLVSFLLPLRSRGGISTYLA